MPPYGGGPPAPPQSPYGQQPTAPPPGMPPHGGTPYPPQGPAPQAPPPGGPAWPGPRQPYPQGPPGGHLPPPPPHAWPQQPRRKRGISAAGVVGLVFGSVAAMFVLLVIGTVALRSSSGADTTTPVAIPTYEPPTRARDPFPTTSDGRPTQTRATETSTPEETETSTPEETAEPPAQVKLDRSLRTNTLYRGGSLPRLSCPAGNANVFDHAQLKALILKTGACMNRAWKPVLEKQGIPFSPPNYAIAARRGRGACGDYPQPGGMVPYYCPRNNTIYASTSAMARGNGRSRGYGQILAWNGGIISMMAHEYGHHVQNLTGLMDSWWAKTVDTGARSGKLALSRRLELQATCFAGMWMRSVATSYPVNTSNRARLFWLYSQVGDYPGYPRDHGSPPNNNRWFRQGWERGETYQCNTWMAASSTTS
ncbi:neutral zinc metallopeptidase [Nonomuraea roseoviolacea]|uniref:Metalloprotease n=1 Tax=Nonomuraea roseoviolacea subsp. carminata TaxID=160689 RepID=A0ABT1KF06_9ACTN|nr:neutral zinc metallopeptidase [Nonomuraea roseoviolacea]MCP2352608.1 putative metalloprotease [Nonomuraea roseoviolacea subsp. carminata]